MEVGKGGGGRLGGSPCLVILDKRRVDASRKSTQKQAHSPISMGQQQHYTVNGTRKGLVPSCSSNWAWHPYFFFCFLLTGYKTPSKCCRHRYVLVRLCATFERQSCTWEGARGGGNKREGEARANYLCPGLDLAQHQHPPTHTPTLQQQQLAQSHNSTLHTSLKYASTTERKQQEQQQEEEAHGLRRVRKRPYGCVWDGDKC